MKIKKFNESSDFENRLEKLNKETTIYTLWGEKTHDKEGKIYPNIKAVILSSGTLENCVHFYKLNNDYDKKAITKTVSKTEILSQEEIDILLDTKKYNV